MRKRNGSKFKDVDLILDEKVRKLRFIELLGQPPFPRAKVIEAFFRSTFDAWENSNTSIKESSIYVGYSPAIGIDAGRIIRDFPSVKIMHIIRNPFSAYFDTKRRPFPQPILKYLITWNIYHSTAEIFANMFPSNVKIFRYEDLVSNKEIFMRQVSEFLGVDFNVSMLYPSWNGKELTGDIAPWGTVLRSSEEYNKEVIDSLSQEEKEIISSGTAAIAKHFNYDQISYLKGLY